MPLSIAVHPLIRKLELTFGLTAEEKAAIVALPFVLREMPADQDIVRVRDRPTQCCIVVEGMLYRYKMMEDGRRQIFAFHIAGDMPDIEGMHLGAMDHSIATINRATVALLPHTLLRPFLRSHPRIAEAMWRNTLIDAAIFREWMANVGRRRAYGRLAHFICEMYVRMRAMRLTTDDRCDLPITQEELGDAIGLSTVHVNRILQELRSNGLISGKNRAIQIANWEGLQEAGAFEDLYLHLQPEGSTARN